MNFGTITEEAYKEYVASGELKNCTVVHEAKNGTKTIEAACTCSRCGGTGVYSNIGVCYRCGGSGREYAKLKVASPEQIAKNKLARQKRSAKKFQQEQEELRAVCEAHPSELWLADWMRCQLTYEGEPRIYGIKAETEKAALCIIKMAYGLKEVWVPKKGLIEEPENHEEATPDFPTDLKMKDWFFDQTFTEECVFESLEIKKETPKAYFCDVHMHDEGSADSYTTAVWVPKSCTEKVAQ